MKMQIQNKRIMWCPICGRHQTVTIKSELMIDGLNTCMESGFENITTEISGKCMECGYSLISVNSKFVSIIEELRELGIHFVSIKEATRKPYVNNHLLGNDQETDTYINGASCDIRFESHLCYAWSMCLNDSEDFDCSRIRVSENHKDNALTINSTLDLLSDKCIFGFINSKKFDEDQINRQLEASDDRLIKFLQDLVKSIKEY